MKIDDLIKQVSQLELDYAEFILGERLDEAREAQLICRQLVGVAPGDQASIAGLLKLIKAVNELGDEDE